MIGTKGYSVERSLSIGYQKVLEKPFKSMEKPGSYEDGKSFLRDQERERNMVAFHLFLREQWR